MGLRRIVLTTTIALAFLIAAFAACAGKSDPQATGGQAQALWAAGPTPHTQGAFCATDDEAVEQILARMSVRDKAAQLFVVGAAGRPHWMPKATRTLVRDYGVGGVFLQPLKNMPMGGADAIAKTVNRFNELAREHDPAIPLLFPIDQEGGIPQALQSLFGGTDGPGNPALAATGDPEATRTAYAIMGREVRAVGGNVAFAPTLDRMPSPEQRPMYTRTFGDSTEVVTAHAAPAVEGFQSEGTVACIKHFPGGGMAFADPHYGAPVETRTEAEFRRDELPPFAAALDAGADMVMTTQVRFAFWDDLYPATFSKTIKVDLLRKELGFDGVLITDDMGMGAITGRSDLDDKESKATDWGEENNVLAVQTGSDMVLYVDGVDAERMGGYIDTVAAAIEDGRIPMAQVDDSIRRILRLKQKYCLFDAAGVDPERAERIAGSEENRETIAKIMHRGETLVRNDRGLWPLSRTDGKQILVVSPMRVMFRDPGSTWPNATGTTLGKQIRKLHPNVDLVHYMPGDLEFLMDWAVNRAQATRADVIVVGSYNAHYDPPQAEMIRKIIATGKPVVVVSLATPFGLMDFPEAQTFLATYSFRTLALESAAQAVFGMHEPGGVLPQAIPGLYPAGYSALSKPQASGM